MIDNYDSFTYNLYQFIGIFNSDIKVVRNDKITIEEIEGIAIYIGMRYFTVDSTGGTAQEIDTVIAVGIDYGLSLIHIWRECHQRYSKMRTTELRSVEPTGISDRKSFFPPGRREYIVGDREK